MGTPTLAALGRNPRAVTMATRNRRILKELAEIESDKDSGVTVEAPDPSNLAYLYGYIPGAPDTPYAGGTWKIEIKIWHPNVSSVTGAICLDTLKQAWSPVQTLKVALISIRGLLESPQPDDPQDAEVARQMVSEPLQWARQAQEWAIQYAGAPRVELDFSKYDLQHKETNPDVLAGYSEDLVFRFTRMGFAAATVVRAFQQMGVPKVGYEPLVNNEEFMGAVIQRLLGE